MRIARLRIPLQGVDDADPFARRSHVLSIAIASAAAAVFELGVPLAVMHVYDRVLPSQNGSLLLIICAGAGLLIVLEAASKLTRSWLVIGAESHAGWRASTHAVDSLLVAECESSALLTASDVIVGVQAAKRIAEARQGRVVVLCVDAIMATIFFSVLFLIAPMIAMTALGVITLYASIERIILVKARRYKQGLRDANARRFDFLMDTMPALTSFRKHGATGALPRIHERLKRASTDASHHLSIRDGWSARLTTLAQTVMITVVMIHGAWLVTEFAMSSGALIASMPIAARLIAPVGKILRFLEARTALRHEGGHLGPLACLRAPHRFRTALDADPSQQDRAGSRDPFGLAIDAAHRLAKERETTISAMPSTGSLSVLGLRVFEDPEHATNTFHVFPRECVLLASPSPAALRRLTGAIMGSCSAPVGSIIINGKELSTFDPDEIALHVGYIGDSSALYDGSIIDNITRHGSLPYSRAMALSERIGLHDVVSRMPDGYATVIHEGSGDLVPGGVGQRIAIVRALCSDPPLIVLDNPELGLDAAGRRRLVDMIDELAISSTIVMLTSDQNLAALALEKILITPDGSRRVQNKAMS